MKQTGRVTYVGNETEPFFYIDDGSQLEDGSGHLGLKVSSRTLTKPSLNSWVVLTGLSSCEQGVTGRVVRVLRPRRHSDIQMVTP